MSKGRITRTVLLSAASLVSIIQTATTGLCDDNARGVEFFEKKIRPVLVKHCYECHSSQAKELKAGLRLDTRAGSRKGGESGPAVVAGDVEASLLIGSIKFEDFEMPPKGKLPDSVIEDFVNWVKMGAPDPRQGDPTITTNATNYAEAAKFWSFQPIANSRVPTVADADWPIGSIDRFVLSRLERKDLRPAQDASPVVLIRRLYVDLISPKELQRWTTRLRANRETASVGRALVDHLLASPHFGERWGRHWLDLARYADSTGGGASSVLPDAWKYRDYVIRSFNNDTPFDQFLREQIVGDLLPWEDVEQRATHLAATEFLVLGPRNYITDDKEIFRMDGIDEQVDTIGRVFLGMTIGCSRCHDHKFDSISHADYHALSGILGSTQTARPISGSKNFTWNIEADPREDPDGSQLAEHEAGMSQVRALSRKITLMKRAIATARDQGTIPVDADTRSVETWIGRREKQTSTMQAELAALRKKVPPKPATLMAVRCDDDPRHMRIRLRGNPYRTGDVVRRGFPKIISRSMPGYSVGRALLPVTEHATGKSARPTIPAGQSGRLELANWLASPRNPLTARVFVNRVWHHLFGRGIVTTVDNFGTTGELPTHPELLDWLARQLIEDGWSVKTLIKRIATSRTYRLGAHRSSAPADHIDPDNLLFGRRTRRNLDAETMRDTMLAVSGELDLHRGGRSFPDRLRQEFSHAFQSTRRSVYVPRFRNNPLELFQTFDAAIPTLVVGQRSQTILPTQALFLINSDFVIHRSIKSAQRLLAVNTSSTNQRIELMYLRTLCRKPSAAEAALAREFVEQPLADAGLSHVELWSALQQTLFECVDFRFVK